MTQGTLERFDPQGRGRVDANDAGAAATAALGVPFTTPGLPSTDAADDRPSR